MTDLNDKKKRQDLMLRYLNAETTIEEEQFLQNCLEHSEEQLTPEEEDLLLIISSTRHVGDVEPSDDKEAEFDKMIAGETLVGKNHKTAFRLIWPSSMLIAVMLALPMMSGAAFAESALADGTYTFAAVSSDHRISAFFKQKTVAPVLNDIETGIKGRLTSCRNVIHVIHRLIDACIGIKVTAESHTE